MPQFRTTYIQTRRDAWVEINLSYIEDNIKKIKEKISKNVKLLAVIKADAYGHGATMLASTLVASGVDVLGVASVDEGIQLREAGIKIPVLVLGSAPEWSFTSAIENDIQLSVFLPDHIKSCNNAYDLLKKKARVHIKVDTGMHRVGIHSEKALDFIKETEKNKKIKLEGIFTHLACAENYKKTIEQKNKWENLIQEVDKLNVKVVKHVANTSAVLGYSNMQYDMIRAGIGIYGLKPDLHPNADKNIDLKQAIGVKARIVHIQTLEQGCGISYGHTYTTPKDHTKIATVPIGYADGISRSLSNNIYGLIKGKKTNQVGNITMDQMMFDITNINNVEVGDIITLLGEDSGSFISVDSWAEKLNTINYEITCKLRVRLPKVYTRIS